jgi:uncharacterized protein YndB with AHSA1/START domain
MADETSEGLQLTRTFDAPIDMVWDAWTLPEHFSKWWGPKPYTAAALKMDVRAGGEFIWSMKSPEGEEHFNAGTFREVDPRRRLVCELFFSDAEGNRVSPAEHGLPGDWDGQLTIDVAFEDLGERTKITVRQTGFPPGEFKNMATAGWSLSLDKLHESLVEGRSIVLGRVFDAPRTLVWEAWTKPEHIANWWGPDGFKNKTHEMDFREGGIWRHTMIGPDGTEYPNRTEYVEIVEPERLVYRTGTDDQDPEWFRATVTFMEFAGQTHVNMISVFPNKEMRDEIAEKSGAVEGGKQHLARLGEYLKEMQ